MYVSNYCLYVALNTWMRTGFKFIYHRNFRKWRFSIFITWNALPRTCPTIWSPLFQLSQSIFHCSTVHSQLYTGIHDMLNQILATVLLLPLCPYSVVWWFDMCIHFQAQKPSCLMDYNIFREIRDEDSSVHCSKSFSLSLSPSAFIIFSKNTRTNNYNCYAFVQT